MTKILSVITPQAPIRVSAIKSAGLDTEALFGEIVIVNGVENGFAYVKLDTDGYSGWVPSHCLGKAPDATHQIIVPHSYVTKAADIKSEGISHLSLGARLHVLKIIDRIAKIIFAGSTGFVPCSHIAPLSARCEDWVAVAESLIGSPYRWGGRTSTGLDCSALVQLALATAGKAVPRDSGPQHKIGEAVKVKTDLRRGDLVFWAGHVGIMQDDKKLLHANAHHMAVVSEPLNVAEKRIAVIAGSITALRRP